MAALGANRGIPRPPMARTTALVPAESVPRQSFDDEVRQGAQTWQAPQVAMKADPGVAGWWLLAEIDQREACGAWCIARATTPSAS